MSKSFLNEAFDRKFGFKDISDEIETEELKRPKRKKYSEAIDDNEKTVIYRELGKFRATPKSNYGRNIMDARKVQRLDDFESAREIMDYYNKYFGTTDDDFEVIDEAFDYGGAYDIDPSQYFTRDDINEFAEQVVDAINTKSYSKVTLISSYIENNVIEVTVEWDGNEATATQKIDMRKIRRPQQIDKYVKPISDELIRQLKEVGFDAGPHLRGQDYPLDEATKSNSMGTILSKIKQAVKKVMTSPSFGFEPDDVDEYSAVEVDPSGRIEVRAEVDYDGLMELCDALNPIVEHYDQDSYFEPVAPGIIEAYIENDKIQGASLDTGKEPHWHYPLDEAFGIDDDDYMDILGGFIDMGYSDEDAERKITKGEYMYYAGVTDDADLGEQYISDIGSIQDAVSNWKYYIDEDKLRNDLSYDIDEIMRDSAEEAVREEHENEDESDYDFDEEVENWIEEHRDEYLDNEVEIYMETMSIKEAESYFDYEALGRDLRYDGWFYTDNGALYIE